MSPQDAMLHLKQTMNGGPGADPYKDHYGKGKRGFRFPNVCMRTLFRFRRKCDCSFLLSPIFTRAKKKLRFFFPPFFVDIPKGKKRRKKRGDEKFSHNLFWLFSLFLPLDFTVLKREKWTRFFFLPNYRNQLTFERERKTREKDQRTKGHNKFWNGRISHLFA